MKNVLVIRIDRMPSRYISNNIFQYHKFSWLRSIRIIVWLLVIPLMWNLNRNIPDKLGHYSDVIMGAMASQITSLTNCLFRRISKKISKLRVTGLCVGNSPVTGEFLAQMASNVENVSIWRRHYINLVTDKPAAMILAMLVNRVLGIRKQWCQRPSLFAVKND